MQALSKLVAFFKVDDGGEHSQPAAQGQMQQVESAKLARVHSISTTGRRTDRQTPLHVATRPRDIAETGTDP